MSRKSLVLLGGGHSHVEVLRNLGQYRRLLQQQQLVSAGNVGTSNNANTSPTAPPPPKSQLDDRSPRAPGSPGPDASSSNVSVTMISRGRFTPYSGMLPGWASGFYSFADCHIDLQRLASYAGANLVTEEASGLDVKGRKVLFGDGQPPLPYDVLSVDVGITPASAAVPGADAHATPVKPIDGFVRRYEQLLERYRQMTAAPKDSTSPAAAAAAHTSDDSSTCCTENSSVHAAAASTSDRVMRICIVGGGAGGVELAAAVRYRLLQEERHSGKGSGAVEAGESCHVSLVCRGGLMPGHPPHVRKLVRQLLRERGVEVREHDAVVGVTPGALQLRSGTQVPYDECLWCTAASPAPWLRSSGLPTDERGFLLINDKLQSDGGPQEVFAAGDVASCLAHPRPKAGVYAVRQGPPLAANLRAFLTGQPLRPFMPQATAMALISLGDRFCVVSRTGAAPVPRSRSPGVSSRSGRAAAATTASQSGKDEAAEEKKEGGGGNAAQGGDGDDGDGDDVKYDIGDVDGAEWPLGWLLNGCGGRFVGLTGPLLWRWKDAIDRAFMCKYGGGLLPVSDLDPKKEST